MTAEKFQDPKTDMMEVYYFFYQLRNKTKKSLSFGHFRHFFSLWIFNVIGTRGLIAVQYYVTVELNKHFEI